MIIHVYEVTDDVTHWVVAENKEQVMELMQEKYWEYSVEERPTFNEIEIREMLPQRNIRYVFNNGTEIQLRIAEWIDLFYPFYKEPVYWACSEW